MTRAGAAAHTPVGIALGHYLHVLFHRVFLRHALENIQERKHNGNLMGSPCYLDAVPRVPLGARLHLHGPWLRALDVADSCLRGSERMLKPNRGADVRVELHLFEKLVPAHIITRYRCGR
jgi:hypothetical protein